jgi:Rrf2 family protein
MLSQRSRYALRAMLVLAASATRLPMRTGEIAKAASISPKFLEAILLELRKGGLLISHRGCKGGFQLARPPKQISFVTLFGSPMDHWRWRHVSTKCRLARAATASPKRHAKSVMLCCRPATRRMGSFVPMILLQLRRVCLDTCSPKKTCCRPFGPLHEI